MTAFWIVNSEKKTNTHISKPDLYFAVTSLQYTVSMHGYVSYSPETASKYSLVITNQRDSLIMYEGSDSFGECHSETLVSLHPASPCGRHKSELRQDFQSSVFLLPYLHLLSLPVIQTPFQSRAAALTSLPRAISCLLLEPCWLYRDTGDARVLHHCEKLQLSLVNFFFFYEMVSAWLSSNVSKTRTHQR